MPVKTCHQGWIFSLLLLTNLLFSDRQSRAEEARPRLREIHGTVLNIDGSPASGRYVRLIGLSRGSSRPYVDEPQTAEGWDFKTDDQGRFLAKLGEFRSWEDEQNQPGWGHYVFVVPAGAEDAGAVSSHLLSFEEKPGYYGESTNEWGPYQEVPPRGLDITLQIKEGITLVGRVLKYPVGTKPLAGIVIATNNDLYSESHSGHGGEILYQRATTDAEGKFQINHIYPVRFYVGLHANPAEAESSNEGAHWLKTKLPGEKWVDDVLDSLIPAEGAEKMHIDIMAAPEATFRYHGNVRSASGTPVERAKVTFGVSWHPSTCTFEDHHTYRSAVTKADGTFDLLLPTPWIRGMSVEAGGFERADQWEQADKQFYEPGAYDFTLKSK